jgi:hypothetical protein
VEQDIKEVIGVLMRILDGGEISRDEVEDLAFEATGELQTALNETYIELLEFAYDHDARRCDQKARPRNAVQVATIPRQNRPPVGPVVHGRSGCKQQPLGSPYSAFSVGGPKIAPTLVTHSQRPPRAAFQLTTSMWKRWAMPDLTTAARR